MIKKILIANRGEIAIRVMRSCKEMGIKSVAVYSEVDRTAMHTRYADEAYFIGPSPSSQSYLVIDKIIEVARLSGADAIHPGYGFLSENATFSDRCKKEGIIFIGPDSNAIATMGDKITARKTMIASGVPVVPGTMEGITDVELAKKTIMEIGLPVMIKASAGGGGKGMRLVKREADIISSINGAKSEARSAFGDDAVYIEKFIENPHHIEFQIVADKHGNAIHLCERECSIQRRHQKVVEETPSPLLTPEMRTEMGKHAVQAATSINYHGAGTIEFLADNNQRYYFLEMNTRLQVEHPITELVTGVDLVKEQIRIAEGKELSYTQEDIKQVGHAIECRVYAEDADNNFMPSPGMIQSMHEPAGMGVRIDGCAYSGYEIPIYYDPMISKLIVWASTRHDAILRMNRALEEYVIAGVKTSIPFLKKILAVPQFVDGNYDTDFIDHNSSLLIAKKDETNCDCVCGDIARIAAFLHFNRSFGNQTIAETERNSDFTNNWKNSGRRRAVMNRY